MTRTLKRFIRRNALGVVALCFGALGVVGFVLGA